MQELNQVFLLSHGKLNPFTESGCAVFSISHISRNYIVDLKFSRWLFLVVFETVFVQKQNYSFEDWLPLETTILNSTICVPIANLQHHLSQNITPQFAPSPTSRRSEIYLAERGWSGRLQLIRSLGLFRWGVHGGV